MRRLLLISIMFVVSMPAISFAFAQEEWKEFRSNEDHFTAKFPGNPTVTDTVWESEYGAYLPAHIYTAKQGPGTFSMTVVDYNLAKMLDTQNAKRCPPALEPCDGLTSYSGEGYWKNDVRGAMIYAEFKMMQRDAKVKGNALYVEFPGEPDNGS
jgi:hypothetical protein